MTEPRYLRGTVAPRHGFIEWGPEVEFVRPARAGGIAHVRVSKERTRCGRNIKSSNGWLRELWLRRAGVCWVCKRGVRADYARAQKGDTDAS